MMAITDREREVIVKIEAMAVPHGDILVPRLAGGHLLFTNNDNGRVKFAGIREPEQFLKKI
jgi:hypothetical protein